MGASLRLEVFADDLDAFVYFYVELLRFTIERDERKADWPYVSVARDEVRLGAVVAWAEANRELRLPPQGIEIVLEVDDLTAERDALVKAGWPLVTDIALQPWGLSDFRVLDPDGNFLRLTTR